MGLRAKGTARRAGRSRPAEGRERASHRAATNSLRFASRDLLPRCRPPRIYDATCMYIRSSRAALPRELRAALFSA